MDYAFRPLTLAPSELEKVTALLHATWPENSKITNEYVNWLYRENPDGGALGFNAWSGDLLAGHYAVVPFRAKLGGVVVRSALSLNTAVHEAHRGQGLFKKLAERTYDLAGTEGIDHIAGIANANSTPGFVRRLGFQLVAPLEIRFMWGRPELVVPFEFAWMREWGPESLKWRVRCPGTSYWYESDVSKLTVLGETKYPGVCAILKTETDVDLKAVIARELPRRRTLRPVLWFGTGTQMRLPCSVEVPARFRPSPFNFIFRSLKESGRAIDRRQVHFAAADFDVM